jgi:hypothetical protein
MEGQIRIPTAIDSFNFKRRDNITAISKKLFCGECNDTFKYTFIYFITSITANAR